MSLRATLLHESGDLAVYDVACRARCGEAAEEQTPTFEIVLPVTGVFRRTTPTGTAIVDAATGYVARPGAPQRIEHLSAGDRCVALLPSDRLAEEVGADRPDGGSGWVVDRPVGRLALLAGALRATPDRLAAEERWIGVLAAGLAPPARPGATSAAAAHQRRAVDRTRAALAADPGRRWTLRDLSAVAGYAPHHLSRLFHRHTGMTVSDHRERVRLAAALVLLREGAAVAEVAAALGYADHGHLTRRVRAALGTVPSHLR